MDANASFAAWVAALNQPHDRALLAAAVDPQARIERHGPLDRGEPPPTPVEVIVGVTAIAAWLERLRRPTIFALAGVPRADGDDWTVEYELRVEELDFTNGGVWVARLADDGRIAVLSHRPFPLPA